jgi:hypothetical protein
MSTKISKQSELPLIKMKVLGNFLIKMCEFQKAQKKRLAERAMPGSLNQ